MAVSKKYSYYIKGGKLAILEYNETKGEYRSPDSAVTDGVEIEFVESPAIITSAVTNFRGFYVDATTGRLILQKTDGNDWDDADVGKYVYITGSKVYPEINGIHRLTKKATIKMDTDFIPKNNFGSTLIESDLPSINYCSIIENEESDLMIDEHLARGLVYYLKARTMEDAGNVQMKEYWMREYNRFVSERDDKKIWGPRVIVPGKHGIKK